MAQEWDTIRVLKSTYKKIVTAKSKAEASTGKNFSMAQVVDNAVEELIKHVDEGLIWWEPVKD